MRAAFLHHFVELACAFHYPLHYSVPDDSQNLAALIDRLHALTATGDFNKFTAIAHFLAGRP
ncbi:hypothetical protein [Streptomyces sp. NPDC059828]|uniref:hypothetical protein n=1 Tax=Streptomyces sp. NPDC059828 TaxID=3346965 RepID=UPI00364C37EF